MSGDGKNSLFLNQFFAVTVFLSTFRFLLFLVTLADKKLDFCINFWSIQNGF